MKKLLVMLALPLFLMSFMPNHAAAADAGTIDGTVYSDTAKTKPLKGVYIRLYKPFASTFTPKWYQTGEDGKFKFTGLATGDQFEMTLEQTGYKKYIDIPKTGQTRLISLSPNPK